MDSLSGKKVVVTGGGTGIGAGIAGALAAAGCQVVIGGRRQSTLDQVCETIQANIHGHVLDVACRDSVRSFFQFVGQTIGTVDILVNSAGVNIVNRTMAAMQPEDWDRVLQVNATGAYNCMLRVLPEMRQRGDGLIVNISSIAGKRAASLGGIAYCASKFAMTALGTAVSNEVRQEGVRVTNVYPGEVNTPILDNRPTPVSDQHKAAILQPEDVAAMVVAVCRLPPRAHVPEIVIKPTIQEWL